MDLTPLMKLDPRQLILGGIALLLILVHMVAPAAGIDDTSLVLLVFLGIVLYGDDLTQWLAQWQVARPGGPKPESELPGRVRQVAYQVEHARVAATTEGMAGGGPVNRALDRVVEHSAGQPRAALLLVWGALEDRLRAVTGAPDGQQAARRLAQEGRVSQQFVKAFEAFRSLRDDLARAGNGDVTDEILWSLVDIGGGLLQLAPIPRSEEQSRSSA